MLTPATATVTEDTLLVATGNIPAPVDPDNFKDGIVSDVLTFIPITNALGTYGVLSMDSAGHYTYTLSNTNQNVQDLNTGQHVEDIFTYSVQDQHGALVSNTLTVTVQGNSNDPIARAVFSNHSITEDTNALAGDSPTLVTADIQGSTQLAPQNAIEGQSGTNLLNGDASEVFDVNVFAVASGGIPQPSQTITKLSEVLSTESSESLEILLASAPASASTGIPSASSSPHSPQTSTPEITSVGTINPETPENMQDSIQHELVKHTAG